jgi:hypothetical protein
MIKLKCGNLGQANKYWLEEKQYIYFARMNGIVWNTSVKECEKIRDWFVDLGEVKHGIMKKKL